MGCTPQVGHPPGEPKTVRASDPPIVLGDGRSAHRGKGRTGRRSLHRKHGPNLKDRTHNAIKAMSRIADAHDEIACRVRNR